MVFIFSFNVPVNVILFQAPSCILRHGNGQFINWQVINKYLLQQNSTHTVLYSNGIPIICHTCWSLLYSANLCSRADALYYSVYCRMWLKMNVAFYSTLSVCYTFYGACAIWNCCYLTAFCVHRTTNEPHSMSSHLMHSHIRRLYACLAITCHLHFWQRQEWNRYRNKVSTESWSRRRKVSRLDSNPPPFNHESGALTTCLSPLMQSVCCVTFTVSVSNITITVLLC